MISHQLENEKPVRLTVSKDDEVAIRQHADRVGKQLGEVAANLISEIMIAFLSGKIQATPAGLNPIQTAPTGPNLLQNAATLAFGICCDHPLQLIQCTRIARYNISHCFP